MRHSLSTEKITLQANYASFFAIYGVMLPFLPVILREHGHSDAVIAKVLAMNGLAVIVMPLIVSHLADTKNAFRAYTFLTALVTTVTLPLHAWGHSPLATAGIQFVLYGALIPLLNLLDAHTTRWCRKRDLHFASVRIWGSLGFLMPTGVLLFVALKSHQLPLLAALFAGMGTLLLSRIRSEPKVLSHSRLPSWDILAALKSRSLWPLFVGMFFAEMGATLLVLGLPRVLQEDGAGVPLIGITIALGVLAEIVVMPFAGKLHHRFGERRLLLAGIAAALTRMLLLAVFPTTLTALLTAPLHAPLVLAWFVVTPMALSERADDRMRFSLQAAYSVFTYGIARTIGPLCGGILIGIFALDGLPALRVLLFTGALLCGIGLHSMRYLSVPVDANQPDKHTVPRESVPAR